MTMIWSLLLDGHQPVERSALWVFSGDLGAATGVRDPIRARQGRGI